MGKDFLRKNAFSMTMLILILAIGLPLAISMTLPVYGLEASQTIPTRTPTPQPATPTKSSGGGSNPTNTPEAVATVTATATEIAGTLAPTPVGGFLPTAVPDSDQPTITAINTTNVRSGPGENFEVIYQLVFLEVRHIVGQSEDGDWWAIVLPDNSFGWVAKEVVTTSGNITNVPILTPEDIAQLTPMPTNTPLPEPTATFTPLPTMTNTAVPIATDTAVPPTDTPTPIPQRTRVGASTTPRPTAAPLENPEDNSPGTNWLLIIAGALLLVGIAAYIISRRK